MLKTDKIKELQNADLGEIAESAKDYARQNPGQAILISAAAGLLVGGRQPVVLIEFDHQASADRYAKDPVHEKCTDAFVKIREASLSPQITND